MGEQWVEHAAFRDFGLTAREVLEHAEMIKTVNWGLSADEMRRLLGPLPATKEERAVPSGPFSIVMPLRG